MSIKIDKLIKTLYNEHMEYKMIGLDLDGTLLKDDKSIDAKTKEYLETLSANGVHIVPITGRPLSGIPDCVRNIKGVDYIISNNGSKTVLNSTNETLFSLAMDNATSKRVIEDVRQTGAIFEVFLNHYGYCEKFVFDHYKEVYTGTVLGDYIFSSRKQVDGFDYSDAMITADFDFSDWYVAKRYYGFAHFSKFVPVGSVVLDFGFRPSEDNNDFNVFAFLTPDNKTVLVAVNEGESQSITVDGDFDKMQIIASVQDDELKEVYNGEFKNQIEIGSDSIVTVVIE